MYTCEHMAAAMLGHALPGMQSGGGDLKAIFICRPTQYNAPLYTLFPLHGVAMVDLKCARCHLGCLKKRMHALEVVCLLLTGLTLTLLKVDHFTEKQNSAGRKY